MSDPQRQLRQHIRLARELARAFPEAQPKARRECFAMAVQSLPANSRSAEFLARTCVEAKQRAVRTLK
jgi:hypothetical protein